MVFVPYSRWYYSDLITFVGEPTKPPNPLDPLSVNLYDPSEFAAVTWSEPVTFLNVLLFYHLRQLSNTQISHLQCLHEQEKDTSAFYLHEVRHVYLPENRQDLAIAPTWGQYLQGTQAKVERRHFNFYNLALKKGCTIHAVKENAAVIS